MLPSFYDEFYDVIGNPNGECDKEHNYKNVIFWSLNRKDYQKTNWWRKTAGPKISDKITIRTVNTVKKIMDM